MMSPFENNEEPFEPSGSSSFTSRFLEDFEVIRLLGKGAYGRVFEARKRIDGIHYAVKRIKLPAKNGNRTKVMREVTILAGLNHRNIVRYFHAWCEYPPHGWQDTQDTITLANQLSADSECTSQSEDTCSSATKSSSNQPEKPTFASIFGGSPKRLIPTDLDTPNDTLKRKQFDRYLYIQMELCRQDTLAQWLEKRTPSQDVHHIFREILLAVQHIHYKGLIHRDLKPSNIFFGKNGTVKVGDLGLAKGMNQDEVLLINDWNNERTQSVDFDGHQKKNHTDLIGTRLYMSPEQIDSKPYNHKVDVYALALILVELLVPFNTGSERIKVLTQLKSSFTFPPDFAHRHVQTMLVKMLSTDPDNRPEVTDILTDPWINQQSSSKHNSPNQQSQKANRKRKHYKILVIGDQNTGKTSIIHRYVHRKFLDKYQVTVGAGINMKEITWSDRVFNLEFCDVGGEERNRFMTSAFYRKAVGAFVVTDVNQPDGLQAATLWKKDLDLKLRMHDDSLIPCVLLINKCDSHSTKHSSVELDPTQVDRYCCMNKFAGWFDTSAKDDINIDEAVLLLIGKILANETYEPDEDPSGNHLVQLNESSSSEKKKSRC